MISWQKFTITIIAMFLAAFHERLGLSMDAVWPLVTAAGAYNVGQGIADQGKSAEKMRIKQAEKTDTPPTS